MLILVGVTINVALNGGLFDKAKDAAMKTEKTAILEQIIGLAEWDNNGEINVKATVDNVIEKFGADKVVTNPTSVTESTTQAIVAITGKHGHYNYKITTREISEEEGSGPQSYSEYYFTFNMINSIEQKSIEYNVDASMIMLSSTDFWGAVGADLSGQYSISTINFGKVNADNLIIPDNTSEFAEVYNGSEIVESNNLFALIEQDGFIIIFLIKNPKEEIDFENPTNVRGVVSLEGDSTNDVLSWEEFLTLYGDIKFNFKGSENKPDTEYYGYYKTTTEIGTTTLETGFFISDQSYYIGDLYKINNDEFTSTKNGYNIGECSVVTTLEIPGFVVPVGSYGYIEEEYTALLEDGTSQKYQNAIFMRDGSENSPHVLRGYLKYENNKYEVVSIQSEYSNEETNIGEDRKIIRYTNLEDSVSCTKSFLPRHNVDEVYEYDTGEGYKLMYSKSGNNIKKGINMLGQDFYISSEPTTLKTNYELQLNDGTTIEYKNALLDNQGLWGYFKDDNTLVKIALNIINNVVYAENIYTKR